MSQKTNKPRSLYWLLLPILFCLAGSIILYYYLRKDKQNNRGIIVGIIKFNWIIGLIGSIFLIINYFDFWSIELFAFVHGCAIREQGMICVFDNNFITQLFSPY